MSFTTKILFTVITFLVHFQQLKKETVNMHIKYNPIIIIIYKMEKTNI